MLRDAERRWLLVPRDVVRRGDRPGLGERFRLLDQLRRDPCPFLRGLPAPLALGALALGCGRTATVHMRTCTSEVMGDVNLGNRTTGGNRCMGAMGGKGGTALPPLPPLPRTSES